MKSVLAPNALILSTIMSLTAFGVAHAGSLTTVYTFQGGNDGVAPLAPLVNIGGVIYGVAQQGGGTGCGGSGCGIVFSLTPSGTEKIVHVFQQCATDGCNPYSGLFQSGNSALGYAGGDPNTNNQTLFEIDKGGKFSVVGTVQYPMPQQFSAPAFLKIGKTSYGVTNTTFGGCISGGCGSIFAVTP